MRPVITDSDLKRANEEYRLLRKFEGIVHFGCLALVYGIGICVLMASYR